jgi:hypothetical protein
VYVDGNSRVNLLGLDLFTDLLDSVRAVSLVVMSSQEVIEPDESKGQVLSLGVLQTLENDLHNLDEIWLQSGTV